MSVLHMAISSSTLMAAYMMAHRRNLDEKDPEQNMIASVPEHRGHRLQVPEALLARDPMWRFPRICGGPNICPSIR